MDDNHLLREMAAMVGVVIPGNFGATVEMKHGLLDKLSKTEIAQIVGVAIGIVLEGKGAVDAEFVNSAGELICTVKGKV